MKGDVLLLLLLVFCITPPTTFPPKGRMGLIDIRISPLFLPVSHLPQRDRHREEKGVYWSKGGGGGGWWG